MFGFFEDLLELGTCVCGLIFTFFCVGPILIAVGIVYLILASNRDRENALTAYNNVVNDWNNQYLSAFSGATFTFSPGGAASVSLGWSKSGTGYQGITDPDKDGVPQYAAAAYASAPVSTSPWRTYSLIATAPNGYTTNLTIPRGSVIEYATVTQSKSSLNCRMPSDCDSYSGSSYTGCIQKQDCYSLCSTYMGTMNGESCSYPAVLDALCIRVKDSGTGMVLDSQNSRYSDIGCFYENKFSVGIYTPLVRSKVYSTYSMADFRAGMYQIPNGVLVRESNDPYIYASWSTQGSYTFGTSTKTKLTIGISTLIAGVILTILIIFLIWCIVKSCSKKKRSTRLVYVEQQAKPQVVVVERQPAPVVVYQQQPAYGPAGSPVVVGQPVYQPYPPQGGYVQPGQPIYYAPPPSQVAIVGGAAYPQAGYYVAPPSMTSPPSPVPPSPSPPPPSLPAQSAQPTPPPPPVT